MPATSESLTQLAIRAGLDTSSFHELLLGTSSRREFFRAASYSLPSHLAIDSSAQPQRKRQQLDLCSSLVFLNCKSGIAATIRRMETGRRGVVIVPITKLSEGFGAFAIVRDNEGNHLGLHEQEPPASGELKP